MSRDALEALELPALLAILRRYVSSPLGGMRLDAVAAQPYMASPAAAAAALAETAEAMNWLRATASPDQRGLTPVPRFNGLLDVNKAVEQLAAEGAALEAAEISAILAIVDRAEETKQRLWRERARRPLLGSYADRIGEFSQLVRDLAGKILPNGELADHASSGLARARRQIEQQRQRVHTSLERFVRKHFDEGLLQDDYATIRNGRSVVPVKASWKGRIEGVIHSASGSGQTVFVEPLETITENNKLVQLQEEEHREVLRILREMTERLRERRDEIAAAVAAMADLEWIFAKARFAQEFRCCIPRFSMAPDLRLKLDWARHPVLEDVLKRQGGKAVPLSLELSGGRCTLVISGPNAGGKTVAMKTAGLLAIMAQAGIPVPAGEAELPWFTSIVADIGDAQSIEASLSTFSAHIENLKRTMAEATSGSLVIIDEIGAATDPQEGGAFAIAVVDYLLEKGAFTLVSTHLPALKIWAANHDRVVTAAMGFDQATLSPTHKLLIGVPGQSAGLAMARRLGVPEEILQRAERALADEEREAAAFLDRLHGKVEEYDERERSIRVAEQRMRDRERELERQGEEREKKKIAELERRFNSALREAEQANKQALDEALAKIDERAASKRGVTQAHAAASRVQREARQRIVQASHEVLGQAPKAVDVAPAAEIREGVDVRLSGFGAVGRVLRKVGDDEWEVQVGQLKMRVASDGISEVLADAGPRRQELPRGVTFKGQLKSRDSLNEINVIGKTVDEAHDEVDKFLDEAVLAEVSRLRVIHGHGAGALRRALWKMFAGHVHVDKYYQAEQQEGGAGATIVEIRD